MLGLMAFPLSAGVHVEKDDFSGVTSYYTDVAPVRKPSIMDGIRAGLEEYQGGKATGAMILGIVFTTTDPVKGPYFLVVSYTNNAWLFIDAGESLLVKADSEMIPFSGNGSAKRREVVKGDTITETALYPISLAQLTTLSKAKEIQIRVIGESGYQTTKWEESTRKPLREFNDFIASKADLSQQGSGAVAPAAASTSVPGTVPATTEPVVGKTTRFKAGIHCGPLPMRPDALFVSIIDPGSPNGYLLHRYITSIEGETGMGTMLNAKLGTIIGKQDGKPINIITVDVMGGDEKPSTIVLYQP